MLDQVFDWLFDPSGLTPHGFCLLWEPGLIWTYALSDVGIGLAYFSIPVALAIFARRRGDLVFRPIFWLFAAFILLCGTTHWFDVLTLWVPAYGIEAAIKVATALVSLVTGVVLWRLLPHALALPSAERLRELNAALAKSEARHRANFERSPVPLYTVDGNDTITAVSDSFLSLLGYAPAEVIGRHISHLRTGDSPTLSAEQRRRLMTEGEILDQERRFLKRDGGVVEGLVSARVDVRDDAVSIICVLIDVTARRQAEAALRASEERLLQSQKMEAIGQLTGGIAHDFNNMLQAVGGCLERVDHLVERGRTSDIPRYVAAAQQSVDRAASLTQRMLAFARRQALQPRAVVLDSMMRGMGELIQRAIGPSVNFRLQLHEGTWSARCDANQLESALLNLAINARDAMPDGGTLTIATADRLLSRADLADQPDAEAGDYVEIAVADTGSGIAPEILSRVFEPFFTTKPIGQGTGLGLSQVYGFVSQSGGFVRLESRLGVGTTVRLYIPRDADSALNDAATPDRGPPAGGGPSEPSDLVGRSVLVVDDEPGVRALISEALHDLGCLVIEAGDGQAALRMIQSPARIELLVTDIGLPGMNGRQVAEAARQLRPDLPVLLISGYAWSALEPESAEGASLVLQKPFNLDIFRARVRSLLAGTQKLPADALAESDNTSP